jgi:signal transduction histidine kinase
LERGDGHRFAEGIGYRYADVNNTPIHPAKTEVLFERFSAVVARRIAVSKVLYVEDHPGQREILAQMIELTGFEVAVASDGLEGVEKARSWLPDLILMDIRMPKMDGFEAIKVIRSEKQIKHIPIIAISAWASDKHKERSLAAGADEHFTKPVDLNRLLTTISRYLKDEITIDKLEKHRQIELTEAEVKAIYAEKMEMEYQLHIWRKSPELASTLEQLTKLTSGLIHDLRNRLGILQNFTPRAAYCLRLLNSLALLRFKPSLSRQLCKGSLEEPEFLTRDLTEFNPNEFFKVETDTVVRKQRKIEKITSAGITAKGLIDTQLLSQGLWLLLHSVAGGISIPEKNQTIPPKRYVITIEDKRPLNPRFGLHITLSASSTSENVLPKTIDFRNALLGNEVALCLVILHKTVFLNGGNISINRAGIEIKVPEVLSEDRNLQALTSRIDNLNEYASMLSQQYHGPKPDFYLLVKGFVTAISRELEDIALEAKAQTVILRNCKYAQLLLQNLLWLGAGFEPPKEVVNISDTLQSVREIMRSEIRERTDDEDEDDDFIDVKVEIQPDLSPVLANRVSLQQVFMNLITNALEAMPESGTLTLRAFQRGSEVQTEVCDTGMGIPPEKLGRIFDLAFSTKQGHERGTGLHIVKLIVDKLGGRVEVESELNRGSTFRVCLQIM